MSFCTLPSLSIAMAVTAVALTSNAVLGARILAVESFAGKSHWNFMSAVLRTLTDNGHAVTAFTPFPDGGRENYTEIDTSDAFQLKVDMRPTELRTAFRNQFAGLSVMVDLSRENCEVLYADGRLNAVLADDQLRDNFDAILVEPGMTSCITYVAAHTKDLPLIFVVATPMNFFTDRVTFGHFPNPATVSPILARHSVPSTFAHRFTNTALLLYSNFLIAFKEFLRRHTTAVASRPYDWNAPVAPNVVFFNGYHVIDPSKPYPPNAVNVGGIHMKPAGRIPQDILEFIDDSPHGVILCTFGSSISMSLMPENIRNVFIETFAVLPQRVLLKYESELENRPSNVMARKWFPQRDILLHPNVKLFICHAGLNGVYEAVDGGVPILGFPVFYDQWNYADSVVQAGMAISMDIWSVSKDELQRNIATLIDDKKYAENAEIASNIFKDRPMSPAQSVVYWTEYVIRRHKRAPHLKSQTHHLSCYQYFLLDVIAVLSILIALAAFVVRRLFRVLCTHTTSGRKRATLNPKSTEFAYE